jgi:hypothetical protein
MMWSATLDGERDGALVSFTKVYDTEGAPRHAILYEGRLNADASEVEGTWTIRGVWSGKFLMIRTRRPPQAAKAQRRERAPAS